LSRIQDKAKVPLKVFDETIVLDARSAFSYGLGHWSEAIHFPWEKLSESIETGQLPKDPSKVWRSLSLIGVDPLTPVIVVGDGIKGSGEEGRLAWALLYYGLIDVQTVAQDAIDIYLTQTPTRPQKNVQMWRKDPRESLRIDRQEFMKKVVLPRVSPDGRKALFIDVRSKEEYFSKSGGVYNEPDIEALHIEWKEFFGEDGRPNLKIRKQILALGYSLEDEVILFSNRGVRSGAASYSLIANGFKRVRNFVPGEVTGGN